LPRITRKPRRSRLKTLVLGCGIGCGAFLLISFLIALVLYSRITAVPPAFRQSPGSSSQEPGGPSSSASDRPQNAPPTVDVQVREIQRAIESRQRVNVSLRLTQAQVNDLIAQEGGGEGALRDLRVVLRDRDVLVMGIARTDWRGKEVYLTAALTPRAVGGTIRFRVDSLQAGTVSLPGSVVAQAQTEIDRAMADVDLVDDRVYVDDVAVSGGELVVSGHTVP
jgi:hypothetical protein